MELYDKEILVEEGEKEYWIPIQQTLAESLLNNFKENDSVTVFVIHVGGLKEKMKNDFDWIFLLSAYAN